MNEQLRDAQENTVEDRFAGIRDFFLDNLHLAGLSRTELYNRPKPGELREPTEEEIVRRWAELVAAPLGDIFIGIQRAFAFAAERGQIVTSFRYCVPQIQRRLAEVREARAGLGPRMARMKERQT